LNLRRYGGQEVTLKELLSITSSDIEVSVLFKSEELAECDMSANLYSFSRYKDKKVLRQEIIKERLFIIIDY
jgi:hypothetical protein